MSFPYLRAFDIGKSTKSYKRAEKTAEGGEKRAYLAAFNPRALSFVIKRERALQQRAQKSQKSDLYAYETKYIHLALSRM